MLNQCRAMLRGSAEKEISQEEGANFLIPSSTSVVKNSVRVSVDSLYRNTNMCWVWLEAV